MGAMKYIYQTVTGATLQASTELATCMISTVNPDREGDRVMPEGGEFGNFLKSPVLMWAHGGSDGYASVPIGSVTGLEVIPGQGVKAEWKWLEGDPFADRIKNAWQQGVVRATSIGFKPITSLKNGTGNDIEKWELLELSLCAIPMNPEAVRSLKALGLIDEHAEVLLMADEEKAVPVQDPATGPEPTPSVPPTPDMIDEPDQETGSDPTMPKDIVIDVSGLVGDEVEEVNEPDVDDPGDDAIDSVMSSAVVGVMQGVLAQMHPVVTATESILSTVTPEMLADPVKQTELSGNLCLLMHQLHGLIEMVDSSAHALGDDGGHEGMSYRIVDTDTPQKSAATDDSTVALDNTVMSIVDDVVVEPMFTIDADVLRSVINDAVKSSITGPAMESFNRAINLARGRVH